MGWVMVICTAGWLGLCGSIVEVKYESKEDCLQERTYLMENYEDKYDYIICKPTLSKEE